jgi:hypothetical protein
MVGWQCISEEDVTYVLESEWSGVRFPGTFVFASLSQPILTGESRQMGWTDRQTDRQTDGRIDR